MRLSRCCATQPITGEIDEKDDIIGKLGQMQGGFGLSSPPAHEPSHIYALNKLASHLWPEKHSGHKWSEYIFLNLVLSNIFIIKIRTTVVNENADCISTDT